MLCRMPLRAALSLLTCRASIALRPTIISRYFSPRGSHRRRLLRDSPPTTAATAAAAKDRRRWVMLSSCGRRRPDDSSSFVADDANTVAESLTSKGQRLRVSLRCAAPPSSSYLYYDFLDCPHADDGIKVVAAHGELLLLELHDRTHLHKEHLVYRPAGARRSPSLTLLPNSVYDYPAGGIGLLRRGENYDDLVAVKADMRYDNDAQQTMAVFSVFRPGMPRWEPMEPVPVHDRYRSEEPRNIISVSDRFLCWVSYGGLFVCDMVDDDEASPKVRYVCLPSEVRHCNYGSHSNAMKVQRMGAAGCGLSSVRLISIHPDCCRSGEPDRFNGYDDPDCCCDKYCGSSCTECLHARFVFTIKTWVLKISMDEEPLEWVEDGEIDGEEIWALPGYEGLPQAIPECPVLCLGEPNVVWFLVSNYHFTREHKKLWTVKINITTKTLLSVVQLTNNDDYLSWIQHFHLPAEIQY